MMFASILASHDASALEQYKLVAASRRNGLSVRLAIGAVGAGVLWLAGGYGLALAYYAPLIVTQVFDWVVYRAVLKLETGRDFTARHRIACMLGSFTTTFVYSGLPVGLWFIWPGAGQVFAMIWLCGTILHTIVHMHYVRAALWAALAPTVAALIGLPVLAIAGGDREAAMGGGVILIAAALFIVHAVITLKTYARASGAMRVARAEAERGRKAAERANTAKTQFLSVISHELRTPMNGILGMAQALRESGLTPGQRDQLDVIVDSGGILAKLVDDILDFASIEEGRLRANRTPIDVVKTVEGVVALWRAQAQAKGLGLDCYVSGETPRLALSDPVRLAQILANLLSNAVKFTDAGQILVRLNVEYISPRRAVLIIEVEDTGCGIAPDDHGRLFSAFEQADLSNTREHDGLGLGLAITQRLVNLLDGEIAVVSTVGQGSTFTVRLPMDLVVAEAGRNARAA